MDLKNSKKNVAVTAVACLCLLQTAFAATYQDVNQGHWAYEAISALADEGIMVGDSSAQYNPEYLIDKFYASKVLAKIAGYSLVGATPETTLYIDRAYDANKDILLRYGQTYQKWDSTTDRELAFLMQKEILRASDLNKFIIKAPDDSEKLQNLTKEEYCIFLVRLLDKEAEAKKVEMIPLFEDDEEISDDARASVYYLRSIGVLDQNAQDNFNPKCALTKADMAVITNKVHQIAVAGYVEKIKMADDQALPASDEPATIVNPDGPTMIIQTVPGLIHKIYASNGVVMVKDKKGMITSYTLDAKAAIYIDGSLKTIWDLYENMQVVCTIKDSAISEIRAQSMSTGTAVQDGTGRSLSKMEGSILGLEDSQAGKMITVGIYVDNEKSNIKEKIYYLSLDCKIEKDGKESDFSAIVVGDEISAGVSGNTMYQMTIKESADSISDAVLIEKKYDADKATVTLKIRDSNAKEHSFLLPNNVVVKKMNINNCKWNDLRVGDVLSLSYAYDKITDIYAVGSQSSVEGIVNGIQIEEGGSRIILTDDNANKESYRIDNNEVDLYGITLFSKVRLTLESKEVRAVEVLEKKMLKKGVSVGYVHSVSNGFLHIAETATGAVSYKLQLDATTAIYDHVANNAINAQALQQGMEVYVQTHTQGGSNYATSVNVVDY